MRLSGISRRLGTALLGGLVLSAGGCATGATRHPVVVSDLGAPSTSSAMEASLTRPGVVAFRRVLFARWTGGRGTFIDRGDPRTAAVPKGDEEARIYAYVIDHPRFGRFMIDGGVSAALEPRLNGLMRRALRDMDVRVDQTTGQWLAGETLPRAVFLTHLHFDHVGGVMDLPPTTPVYVGPGEAAGRSLANTVTGRPADIALEGHGPLREWVFATDPDSAFEGVIDIFGDGSVWALHVPGHSPGSTAFLINAVDGPRLVIGDAVHTRLGWEQGMPQATPFSKEQAEQSAERLRRFAAAHPAVEVFLGHQSRTGQAEATTR